MRTVVIFLQVVAALGLLNVWLLRFKQPSAYRGGTAQSMRDEFAAYGLPGWFTLVVGALKIGAALALIAGIWYPAIVRPAALMLTVLMLGALSMHFKIRDPLTKYVPAVAMLALSVAIAVGSGRQ